jgi:hypothetical protein
VKNLRQHGHEIVGRITLHRRQHHHRRGTGPKRLLARRSSSMSQTHPRGRSGPSWNFSISWGATSLPRKRRRESAITSHCRSSAPNACSAASISARNWLRRISPIPYTIVRATQFFEFVGGIAQSANPRETVRLPSVLDAAHRVGRCRRRHGRRRGRGAVESHHRAGRPPIPIRQDELVRKFLSARGTRGRWPPIPAPSISASH